VRSAHPDRQCPFDNAMADSFNGLYRREQSRDPGRLRVVVLNRVANGFSGADTGDVATPVVAGGLTGRAYV